MNVMFDQSQQCIRAGVDHAMSMGEEIMLKAELVPTEFSILDFVLYRL